MGGEIIILSFIHNNTDSFGMSTYNSKDKWCLQPFIKPLNLKFLVFKVQNILDYHFIDQNT